MINRWLSLCLVVVLLALPAGSRMVSAEDGVPPGKQAMEGASMPRGTASGLVVRFRDGTLKTQGGEEGAEMQPAAVQVESMMTQLSAAAGVDLAFEREMSGGSFVLNFAQPLPLEEAQALASQLAQDPSIERVEPDRHFYITLVPNDSYYSQMWQLAPATQQPYGLDAPAAWNVTTGSENLVVAVIDTGILKAHPELAGRFLPGYDFISNTFTANDGGGRDADAQDAGDWVSAADVSSFPDECGSTRNSSWHGSHVAGTIAASGNNGVGISGLNWKSKILPVRALGKCGGSFSDIIDAMRWSAGLAVPGVPANTTPAKVINMSLGGYSEGCSTEMQSAVNDVNATGAMLVISAGNEGMDAANFEPANCAGVITVGASEMGGLDAYYSNYGTTVEINAPGGDMKKSYAGQPTNLILSTVSSSETTPDQGVYGYNHYQGTSMAAPHIAGIVSLMLSVSPTLTQQEIVSILQETATDWSPISRCGIDYSCGSGAIAHAGRALQKLAGTNMVPSPNANQPAYAGHPSTPMAIQVVTLPSTPAPVISVTIGGQAAPETGARVSQGNQLILTVQAPAQPVVGYYDLGVTIDGVLVTQPKSVLYGVRPQADSLTVAEDSPATPVAVLANDDHAAALGAVVASVGAAQHGTASLVGGQVFYQPALNYFGTDSFTYAVMNAGVSSYSTVSVTVTPVDNDAPAIQPFNSKGTATVVAGSEMSLLVGLLDPDLTTPSEYVLLATSVVYTVDGVAQPALPAGATYDPAQRLFKWKPDVSQIASKPYTFVFTVTDLTGLSGQGSLNVYVDDGKLYLPLVSYTTDPNYFSGKTNTGLAVSFSANPGRTQWSNFALRVAFSSTACSGEVTVGVNGPGEIRDGRISFSTDGGTYLVNGTLSSPKAASGTYEFKNFLMSAPGCNVRINTSGTWSATAP